MLFNTKRKKNDNTIFYKRKISALQDSKVYVIKRSIICSDKYSNKNKNEIKIQIRIKK